MSFQHISKTTFGYYDQNATTFYESTFALDMTELYRPFLARLRLGSKILDAGCGSGRDALNFFRMGYRVTAFDASAQLVKIASMNTGLPILEMSFDDVAWSHEFDGIWACASLLHVPKEDIESVFRKLSNALKPGGVLYVSFKYGTEELIRNDRLFSDYNEEKLSQLLSKFDELSLCESWITTDIRPGRDAEKWINAVIAKS